MTTKSDSTDQAKADAKSAAAPDVDPASLVSTDKPVVFTRGNDERQATSPEEYVRFQFDGWQQSK